MSAVVSKKKRDRQSAIQASTGHSGEGGNSPISSFRTPRSDDPESSASASARHSGEGRNPVAEPVREHQIETANVRSANTPLGDLCAHRVSQDGPKGRREFVYVDISSIDRETKRIVDPKALPASKAPSRARQVLKRGDVLVSMTRPNLNAVAIVPPSLDGAIGSTGFHVLRAKDTDPEFLFYAVQTPAFIDAMCQKVQGALYPAVRPRDISSFCIPCPSRNEQLGIVAEIEKQFTRLDAGVAALRRVQANLKRYRAAILKAACEGRLVPTEAELAKAEGRTYETGEQLLARILADRRKNWHGRGKYKEPSVADSVGIDRVPEGWTVCSVAQVSECLDGRRVPVNKAERAKRLGDIPYFGANGQVGWIDDFLFDEPLVLVVEDETFTGRTQPFSYVIRGKTWVNNHAHVLRATPAVSTVYLNYSLAHYPFTPRTTGSTGRRKLTQKSLMEAPYLLPPAAEQARIVAEIERHISVIEELEAAITANFHCAKCLRQTILQSAFTFGAHK